MSEAALAEAPLSPPPPDDGTTLSAARPFPGLRPFGFADRAYFFGRERQTFSLYRLVENGRFIAVIGSSGSGKSSLVLAGLQSLLAQETADESGPTWAFRDMRPGGAPIKRLAAALATLADKESPDDAARRADRIEWTLRQSSFSFENALEEAGGLKGRSLLLVVDQFEELFRFGLAGLALRRASVEETRARDEATQFVQILLDADRRRLKDVHVLVTMRSDFIGDCAYFHGLSEAVSATQYLVPNLTRSQLEDVIRKPIDKAGAAIEPELVERLINDCGDELDQLPVLQHCLMRLWDRAGADGLDRPRRLTRKTYDDVGRMAEALSRHADEVLAQCAGRELAAEQTFRALSELDRDGRATRRALRFDKLVAETGVAEADLREVLARFRAPGCSFLVPPLVGTPKIAPDDRVDVGHETLLRRWKKLAGDPATMDPATGRPLAGWMTEEQNDGQRYRMLLSLIGDTPDDENGDTEGPSGHQALVGFAAANGGVERTLRRPLRGGPTPDRRQYLGQEALASQPGPYHRKLRPCGFPFRGHRRQIPDRQGPRATGGDRTWGDGFGGRHAAQRPRGLRLRNAEPRRRKEPRLRLRRFPARTAQGPDDPRRRSGMDRRAEPRIRSSGECAGYSQSNSRSRRRPRKWPSLWRRRTQTIPASNKSFTTRSIRYGNALAMFPSESGKLQEALTTYEDAIKVAISLAQRNATDDTEGAVSDAHLKIGDIYQIKRQPEDAILEYRTGLAVCEDAVAKFPGSTDAMRNRANAHFRIAEALRQQKQWDSAENEYRLAEKDQLAIITKDPGNATVRSNLASTYNHWGLLARSKGDLELALAKLKQGIDMQKALMQSDPSNPQWVAFAAPNYESVAKILDDLHRSNEAYRYFQTAYDLRKDANDTRLRTTPHVK